MVAFPSLGFRNTLSVVTLLAMLLAFQGLAILTFVFGRVVEYAGHWSAANTYLYEDVIDLIRWPQFVAGLILLAVAAGLAKRRELARRLTCAVLLFACGLSVFYGSTYIADNSYLSLQVLGLFAAITLSVSSVCGVLFLLVCSEQVRREFAGVPTASATR